MADGGTSETYTEKSQMLSPDQEKQFAQEIADGEGHGDAEKILGKFESQDDLIKAYTELERKLGERANNPEGGDPQVSPDDQPKADAGTAEDGQEKPAEQPKDAQDAEDMSKQADEALKVAGLDMADFQAEFDKTGQLSDESFKKLEDAGFPRQVVENYIAGMQAVAARSQEMAEHEVSRIKNTVGGPEAYGKLMDWASKNLSQQEIDGFEAVVATGNPGAIQAAVEGVKAKYDKVYGVEPNLVSGKASTPAKDTFRSMNELMQAMSDPRYDTDPAYRADVAEKLKRSNIM